MGLTRSGRHILRGLDTSHGCQNHTTWPYAARPTPNVSTGLVPIRRSLARSALASVVGVPSLRSRTQRARPATTFARPTLPRPPHPAPRLVTIAKRPSVGDGMPEVVRVIWGNRETDYFCGRSLFDLRRRANQCWATTSNPSSSHGAVVDCLYSRKQSRHFLFVKELFRPHGSQPLKGDL